MTNVAYDLTNRDNVVRAIGEYDRLGPEPVFAQQGFGPHFDSRGAANREQK